MKTEFITAISNPRTSWSKALGRTGKTSLEFDHEIAVTRADTGVRIEAIDTSGSRTAILIPVKASSGIRPILLGGDRHALLIGISRYAVKPGLPDLDSASLDVRDLAEALQKHAGFKRENIRLLVDDGARHAQLRNALRNFTARPGPDDLLIIYFVGYGLHDPSDHERIYLAAYDTQLRQLSETALGLEEVRSVIAGSARSRQALLLFDVARELQGEWNFGGNNLVNAYLLRLFSGDPTKAVMVASGLGELGRDAMGGHGLFTKHLVEAATGKADWNQDGLVTVEEWFQQVARAVRAESQGKQSPKYVLRASERLIFAGNK